MEGILILIIGCVVYCLAIFWCTSAIKEGKCCCKKNECCKEEEEEGFVYEGF